MTLDCGLIGCNSLELATPISQHCVVSLDPELLALRDFT